jgi:hypothetical protein
MKKPKSDSPSYVPFIFFSLIVVILWFGSMYYLTFQNLYLRPDPGAFGDSFGAINALFSGLAFSGIIYTILLQRKELSLQRKEMKDTRDVLIDQKKQLEIQNKTAKLQQFETTFFNLINYHNVISKDLKSYDGKANYFTNLFYDFSTRVYDHGKESGLKNMPGSIIDWLHEGTIISPENIIKLYDDFDKKYGSLTTTYYMGLFQALKLVAMENLPNPKIYTNILRAKLNQYELLLIFYNCLHSNGKQDFYPLIDQFDFLKHIDKNLIANKSMINHYKSLMT